MELLSQVVDHSRDALLVLVPGGEDGAPSVAWHNRTFTILVGLPKESIARRSLTVLRAPETDPVTFGRLARAIERREPIDLELAIRSGRGTRKAEVAGRPLAGAAAPYLVRLRDVTDGRALARHAEGLERRLHGLCDLASEAAYHLDVRPDCRLVLDWAGAAFERLTGYRPEEIEALGGWTALVEPTDLAAVQRRGQRVLGGEEFTTEYRIWTRSGELRWLRDVARPEWDERRELVVGALCVARDITGQRELEERLVARRLDIGSLASLAGGLALWLTPDGRIDDVDGEVKGVLGGRLRAAAGRTLDDVLAAEDAQRWRAGMARVLPGRAPVVFEIADATAADEVYHVGLAAAGAERVLALVRRSALSRRGEPGGAAHVPDPRLWALLDSDDAPSVLLSPALTVEGLNGAAERLVAWRREGALGRPFADLLGPDADQAAVAADLERALEGEHVSASETWLRLGGEQPGRVVWRFEPLKDQRGTVVAVLAQGDAVAAAAPAAPGATDERQRLRTIIDHIADGVVTLNGSGTIVGFSRSAEVIFDYGRDEIVGRGIEVLLAGGGPEGTGSVADLLDEVTLPGDRREAWGRRKGGEIIPVELAINRLDHNGDGLYILTVRDITVRKQTEETIRSLAYLDALTGLPNRLLFHDRLGQAIERARRHQQLVGVMLLDLDRFKLINDSLGLESGDRVLRAIGERLTGALRRSDTVARLGSDDFLILLPAIGGAENAAKVAQKLLDALAAALQVEHHELHVAASIGIALYPHDGDAPEVLIRNADTALYRAKERSRGSYQFYTTDMNAAAFERLVLETQLRRALERDELMVCYQPQLRLQTGEIVGVEALLRWRHPELGLVSPGEFVPLAEETGLILAIGRWVLATACAQVRAWQQEGFAGLRLAVNLSARQFQDPDLVEGISEALERSDFDPRDLELELTESSIMQDADAVASKMRSLDELGIRLSIDDFGTGYSSLGYLKRFPIRALKIDQSFVQDITADPNAAAIAQAIVALGESLKLRVIAEGVETPQQLELLRRYRCEEMQGFLFSKPLPPDELIGLLRRGARLLH